MIVSVEIFPMKNEKKPMNSISAKPATETNAPPTSVPTPRSDMLPSSRRIGGTRSLYFWARTRPSAPPTSPPIPDESQRERVGVASLHEVLRVEPEHEQVEAPELVPEHLERGDAERGRRAGRDLLDPRRHVAHDLTGLLPEGRLPRTHLRVLELSREQRRDDQDDRADHDDAERRKHGPGAERERDAEDLRERAAGLRQRVALEEVLADEDVGERRRLHRERRPARRLAPPAARARAPPSRRCLLRTSGPPARAGPDRRRPRRRPRWRCSSTRSRGGARTGR